MDEAHTYQDQHAHHPVTEPSCMYLQAVAAHGGGSSGDTQNGQTVAHGGGTRRRHTEEAHGGGTRRWHTEVAHGYKL